MRVIALVSLVLALSVSSLPVPGTPGSSEISQLGGEVKSTVDGAKSAPATPGPRSRALPGSVDTVVPGQVKQVAGQVTGKLDATKASAPGAPNPAGAVGQVLSGVKGAGPASRRGTDATGVTNKVKGAAGNTLDKAKGVASGAQGKVPAVKAPGGADGIAARATIPTPPGSADPAQVQKEVTGAASKVEGAVKGASGTVPGSVPAP